MPDFAKIASIAPRTSTFFEKLARLGFTPQGIPIDRPDHLIAPDVQERVMSSRPLRRTTAAEVQAEGARRRGVTPASPAASPQRPAPTSHSAVTQHTRPMNMPTIPGAAIGAETVPGAPVFPPRPPAAALGKETVQNAAGHMPTGVSAVPRPQSATPHTPPSAGKAAQAAGHGTPHVPPAVGSKMGRGTKAALGVAALGAGALAYRRLRNQEKTAASLRQLAISR